jgi:hypothetical protein
MLLNKYTNLADLSDSIGVLLLCLNFIIKSAGKAYFLSYRFFESMGSESGESPRNN